MAMTAPADFGPAIASLLAPALTDRPLSAPVQHQLLRWELADPRRAAAWGITPANGATQLQERWDWLRLLLPDHGSLPLPPVPVEQYLSCYWHLWLPLALALRRAQEELGRPLIYGILGGQGTGKTTLTHILGHLLGKMGRRAVGLSLDDLYKPYVDRLRLAQADPRLRWRGPPGTHDIDLGLTTLAQVSSARPGEAVAIPRFDKSLQGGQGDRTAPEWVRDVDILLFEGWFVGARPIDPAQFEQAPDPITTAADRRFARAMNERLASYLPLWACLDQLMVLCPADYRWSLRWRQAAEHRMKAQGRAGMDDATLEEFVKFFWRALHPDLFVAPLKQDGVHVSLVVEIDGDHVPSAVYSPPLATI